MKAEKYHVLRHGVTGDLPKIYMLYLKLAFSVDIPFLPGIPVSVCLLPTCQHFVRLSSTKEGTFACVCVCLVSQLCLVPCDSMNYSPVGSSVLGVL